LIHHPPSTIPPALLSAPRQFVDIPDSPPSCSVNFQPIQTALASPLEICFMGTNFQIITWSLFGVLLIAYIGVKMSKRRKQS
jgi:hypothetical protein